MSPQGPSCQRPLSILANPPGLPREPKTFASGPCPRRSSSLGAGPTSGPGRPQVCEFPPRAHGCPSLRQAPCPPAPRSGLPVPSPGKSGRKSHSQKEPKLQRSEPRSQAAAEAESNPSSPRSEPQGRQPRVAAAIRERPQLSQGLPTARPANYSSRHAPLRRSHAHGLQLPAPLPRVSKARPVARSRTAKCLQGELANRPVRVRGPRFHGHGN